MSPFLGLCLSPVHIVGVEQLSKCGSRKKSAPRALFFLDLHPLHKNFSVSLNKNIAVKGIEYYLSININHVGLLSCMPESNTCSMGCHHL